MIMEVKLLWSLWLPLYKAERWCLVLYIKHSSYLCFFNKLYVMNIKKTITYTYTLAEYQLLDSWVSYM